MNENFKKFTLNQVTEVFTKIDNYLIADIKRMLGLRVNKENGDLGYTCLQSIISGIELLGFIYSGKEGDEGFNSFWRKFMSKTREEYKNEKLMYVFRNSIRNGTAHYFMTKAGIAVHRNKYRHLDIYLKEDRKYLHINCKELFKDFNSAYTSFKAQSLDDIDSIQNGLNKLFYDISEGGKCVDNYIDSLKHVDENIYSRLHNDASTGYVNLDLNWKKKLMWDDGGLYGAGASTMSGPSTSSPFSG